VRLYGAAGTNGKEEGRDEVGNRTDDEYRELLERLHDERCNATVIEEGALHVLVEFHCRGLVRRADGTIAMTDRHRVRMVRSPEVHGLLTVYEPRPGETPHHPNIRDQAPFVICDDLESQLERGRAIPLWSVADMVYDMLCGQWSRERGIYNAAATEYYAQAQARGELPFDQRRLI
jgi:hypothetical protein